jgi:NADPH2:quinone reductase
LLAAKGRIVLMAGAGSQPPFPVGPFYQKECTMRGFSILNVDPEELRGYAEIVNRCVAEKHLKYKIAASLPLAETAKAHALIEDKADLWGKIILKP